MRKQETILFVMPRLPFPTTSGRKMSLYHYCRILSEELGYRLVVAAFLENGDEVKDVPYFIDSDMPEWDFKELKGDESFYFNEKGELVITFDETEVAPAYMGAVEFTIPQSVTGDLK